MEEFWSYKIERFQNSSYENGLVTAFLEQIGELLAVWQQVYVWKH